MRPTVGALVALALALSGCVSDSPGKETTSPSPESGGPLDRPTEPGSVSILAPPGTQHWSGSFSSLQLCLTADDETEARIREVKVLDTIGTVEDLDVFVAHTPQRDASYRGGLIYASALGRAPEFAEPYADMAGYARRYTYREDLSSSPVVETCGQNPKPWTYQDLAFTFTTDGEGGAVREWEIVYDVDDKTYTTGPVAWQMTLCGASPDLADHCT